MEKPEGTVLLEDAPEPAQAARGTMKKLDQAYFALFRECPLLVPLAITAGTSQLAFALLNIFALPVFLQHEWHLSGKVMGAAIGTFLLVETMLKAPLGRISDRLERKPFIVLGPLVVSATPVLTTFLPIRLWPVIFPLRAVDGAGAAAIWVPLYAMVGDITRRARRAAAMSVINTVYVGAIGVAAATGALLTAITNSRRAPFYLASALLLASGLVAQFSLPARPKPVADYEEEADQAQADSPHMPYPLSLILLISFLQSMSVLSIANFLMLYMQEDLYLTGVKLGLGLVGLGIPVLLLGLPLGHYADRLGKSFSVRLSLTLSALFMWGLALMLHVVSGHLGVPVDHHASGLRWLMVPWHYMGVLAVIGMVLVLTQIFGTPAWLALVSTLAPAATRGRIMGAVATAEGLGAAVGPLLGGWLWDIGHSFIFFGSAGVLTLAAAVALFTLRRHRWASAL